MPWVPLREDDLVVGQPARWDVFDAQGKLLLERGARMDYMLNLAGVVRAIVPNPDEPEPGTGYGLQFADISPEDILIISAFVFQQLIENKSS